MNSKYYYTIIGKNWQKGFMSTKHIQTRFGKYFHNNIPTQINIQSWSHPQTILGSITIVWFGYHIMWILVEEHSWYSTGVTSWGWSTPFWHTSGTCHESSAMNPAVPLSTLTWSWIGSMVLVDLMLHHWRRISIVSILFSVWW